MNFLQEEQFKLFNELLLDLYSLHKMRDIQERLISGLRKLIPYDSAAFFLMDPFTLKYMSPVFVDLEEKSFASYSQHYEEFDIYKQKTFNLSPIPLVDKSSDLMDYQEWSKNEHRVDFLLPQKIYNLMCLQILNLGPINANISLHRDKKRDFSETEFKLFQLLAKHMENIFKNNLLVKNFVDRYGKEREEVKEELEKLCFSFLTAREKEVASMLILGKTIEETAQALNISINTVKTHTKSIYAKLDCSSRQELILRIYANAENLKEKK